MPNKAKQKVTSRSSKGHRQEAGLPTLTGKPDSELKLSVINSSIADATIEELIPELWAMRVFAIDFYPRGIDIMGALEIDHSKLESISLLDRFSDSQIVKTLAKYVQGQIRKGAGRVESTFGVPVPPETFHVPALATHFPEIASIHPEYAAKAGEALANAVQLAAEIGATVVEFVLGRTFERCRDRPLTHPDSRRMRCEFIHQSDSKTRITDAVKVLKEYVYPIARATGIRLAAEIEPGFSYVLNGRTAVGTFLTAIANEGLNNCIGLNLDIGHLIMLADPAQPDDIRIRPIDAWHWKDHIFHAHASDYVGHHFMDLLPGVYNSLTGPDDDQSFARWIAICRECAGTGTNFSGYIAVALEGCSRIQLLQRSLLRLGHVMRHN